VEKKIEFIEMADELKGKYQYFTKADPAKLWAAGYRGVFTSLEDGVQEYVEFLRSRE
jgi:ADP-L-glycero-D-manno-heptose 6-epimerase